jgi:hypothetical protein
LSLTRGLSESQSGKDWQVAEKIPLGFLGNGQVSQPPQELGMQRDAAEKQTL